MRGKAKISAAAKLRTLQLFEELQSYKKVADALKERDGVEITPSAVNLRLMMLNIRPGYDKLYFDAVAARLEKEVEAEKAAGIELPSRSSEGDPLTKAEIIETLEVFIEEKNYHATGRKLGLDSGTVKDRLVGILGADKAHPVEARRVLDRLKKKQ